jgi:hypothetical protein
MRYILLLLASTFFIQKKIIAQNNAGKIGLEITKAKFGIDFGPYRGRTESTNGFFNQGVTLITQAYFPIQWCADYQKNFELKNTIKDEYNERIFLIRPSVLFQFVDNGSYAMGLALQFSFLLTKSYYLEYQLAGIYLEATTAGEPDLFSGFNLHHKISISKPIARHFSMSVNFIHFSGAGIDKKTTSNQDVIALGIRWNL